MMVFFHGARRLCAFAVILALIIAAFCGCENPSNAYEILLSSLSEHGYTPPSEGVIYSPEVSKTDAGYVEWDYIKRIIGDEEIGIESYAIFMHSSTTHIYEVTLFRCRSYSGATSCVDIFKRRVKEIREGSAGSAINSLPSVEIFRQGKWCGMCMIPRQDMVADSIKSRI